MPGTEILSASNDTVQLWSALLFKSVLGDIYFGKYVGKDPDSIIQTKTDLLKEKGDKISFSLRAKLSGAGRFNDADVEGSEEAMTFNQFLTTVVLWGNGVKATGKMSERRPAFDLKKEMRPALSDWMTEKMDIYTTLALSGLATGLEIDGTPIVAVPPSSLRKWKGGQTITESGTASVLTRVNTDALITNAGSIHLFGPKVISAIKRKMQMATPKIRPINVDGKPYFVAFIHPFQSKSLKADNEWKAAQLYAAERGKNNPIFSGMLGVYDGVVVHEFDKIETRLGDGVGTDPSTYFESGDPCYNGIYVARAIFCGAQAGVHAYAQYPSWYEKNFQYGRVPGVWTDVIMAIQKVQFASQDYAVITVDTAYVPD